MSTSKCKPYGTETLSPSTGANRSPQVELCDHKLTYLNMTSVFVARPLPSIQISRVGSDS